MIGITDLNYVAGFVDGEGCITVSVKNARSKNGRSYYTFAPSTSVTNTNKELLDWARDLFNLGRVKEKPRPKNPNWKLCYHWILNVDETKSFLDIIYPYLRVKKVQARLTLAFYQIKGKKGDKRRAP